MPRTSSRKAPKDQTFEVAVAELEKIVSALESGKISLDEAMRLFERGKALIERCNGLLESAELKVKQLEGDEVQPFEDQLS